MLRVGVLQCDSLDPAVVGVEGDYDELYADLLAHDDIELVTHRADLGDLPRSPTSCDGWVVGGSRHSVYDAVDWIVELRRFTAGVLDRAVPIVGVCFGHQLLGQELGAPVGRSETGWNVGAVDYRLTSSPPGEHPVDGSAAPAEPSFRLVASHKDQVLELPTDATLLATAPTCPVAGFGVGDAVLSIQPHPEFGPSLAASLLHRRVEALGSDVVDRAVATLERPLDRRRAARWMTDFFLDRSSFDRSASSDGRADGRADQRTGVVAPSDQ